MDDDELHEHYYELWKRGYWEIPSDIDVNNFDFNWRPHSYLKPSIHVFGTQWQRSGGPKFIVPEHDDIIFHSFQKVVKLENKTNFHIPDSSLLFDFSWHHDEYDANYHFQWKNGISYINPQANETIYLTEYNNVDIPIIGKHIGNIDELVNKVNYNFYVVSQYIDYSICDFLWKPKCVDDMLHVNVFKTEQHQNTQTMFINTEMYKRGYRNRKYIENEFLKVTFIPSLFFVDHGNKQSENNFTKLKQRFPTIQKIRFFDNWVDTIQRCVSKATTPIIWVVDSHYNYDTFDFGYYPNLWDEKYIHVFGNQWNEWGKTFLINVDEYKKVNTLKKDIELLNPIKLVDQKANIECSKFDKLMIHFGNENSLETKYKVAYQGSYLATIDYWISQHHYIMGYKNYTIWVCSSICEYSEFDFTYEPNPFDYKQLHVFSSSYHGIIEKFGDTFLLNVHEYIKVRNEFDSLQRYKSGMKYIDNITVPRKDHPVYPFIESYVHTIQQIEDETFPYVEIRNSDTEYPNLLKLWDTKHIVSNMDGNAIYFPMVAKSMIKNQLYDYPHIEKPLKFYGKPLDIVFISNGEPNADAHWDHLNNSLINNKATNRVVRVDGINGRVAAYHRAAEESKTRWFFAVFAKLRVNTKFDWSWQPDLLVPDKHYIFTAVNPVNRLSYGHQAMIAYNKKLVLSNNGVGLDFTLDDPHDVINLNSGIAFYNIDAWTTWRTAFREAIKLQDLVVKYNDTDAIYRLGRWCGAGIGEHADYSQRGANDGVAYYNEVNGDFNKLKLSYEWDWLRRRFDSL